MTVGTEQDLRQQLVDYAKQLEPSGLGVGKSGNLSAVCGDKLLITPSAVAYHELQPQHIVEMMRDGSITPGQSLPPSSEWRFHCDLYRCRPDISAIVHAHPPASTALACTARAIPAFHYMVAVAGGSEIPIADYAVFGSQALSDHIVSAIGALNACLLANHGLITVGKDLSQAFNLAREVEQLADQYSRALMLGKVDILSDEEMRQVLQKFKHYGQRQ